MSTSHATEREREGTLTPLIWRSYNVLDPTAVDNCTAIHKVESARIWAYQPNADQV